MAKLNIVGVDGKPISLEKVVSMVPVIADYISKISGTIDLNKKLSDYKRQTSVFT